MSPDDPQKTEEQRSVARGAELRRELAETDARRADEAAARAHEQVEEDREREEKLARKAQEAHRKAETVAAETGDAAAPPRATGAVAAGGGTTPGMAERPEVLAGAAFAGAFVAARILKRIFD